MNRRRFCLKKGGTGSQEHIKKYVLGCHLSLNKISSYWGFGGISPPKWVAVSTKPPKGTSAGRNGSSGVLITSLSAIVSEKSRVNKKVDGEEEEEKRHIFGLFGIAVKWP